MNRSTPRTIALTVLATLLLLMVAGLVYLYSGAYDIAATSEHTALGRWVLNTGQERSIAVRAVEVPAPPPMDSAMVAHGAEHFREMCVVCHGAPGVERGEYGEGITPTPPELSEEAAEWSTGEVFWIVKHGIKLAGMPAFGPTHTDEEIWGIAGFVDRLPELSPDEYRSWTEGASGETGDTRGGAAASSDTAAARTTSR